MSNDTQEIAAKSGFGKVLSGLKRRGRKGFDLMQLLIAMAILVILAGVAVTQFTGLLAGADDAKAQSNVQATQTLVESCYASTRDYTDCNTSADIGAGSSGITVIAAATEPGADEVSVTASGTDSYTLQSKGAGTDVLYALVKATGTGVVTKVCGPDYDPDAPTGATEREGACSAGGEW